MLRLESLRRRLLMSQTDLARRARVDQSHISLVESGRRRPSLRTLVRMARALGVTADPLTLLAEVGGRKRWVFATRPQAKGEQP